MALIDVTPTMLESNTPYPYVVTSNTEYGTGLEAWQCFRGDLSGSWLSKINEHLNSWVLLDFGSPQRISYVQFINTSNSSTDWKCTPKSMEIQGSSDGTNFEVIQTIYNDNVWNRGETRTYSLGKVVEYRYYRFYFKEAHSKNTNGNPYMTLGRIKLYCEENVSINGKTSINWTLPMNTTERILAKVSDPREGRMGMANDSENYGTLYVTGSDGKSYLAKAGVKSEVLWEGQATIVGEIYMLTKSISNFSYLMVEQGLMGDKNACFTELVAVRDTTTTIGISKYLSSSYYMYLSIQILDSSFQLSTVQNSGGWSGCIRKIYGIY